MSLLIKALNKAEEALAQQSKDVAQAQNAKTEQAQTGSKNATKNIKDNADIPLSLSPPIKPNRGRSVAQEMSVEDAREMVAEVVSPAAASASKQASTNISAKDASNVFSAKGMAPKKDNNLLAIMAGLALVCLLGMGAYFYRFIDNTPEPIIPPRIAQVETHPQPTINLEAVANTQLEPQLNQNPSPNIANVAQNEVIASSELEKVAADSTPANRLPPIISTNETVIFSPVKTQITKKTKKAVTIISDSSMDDEAINMADNEDEISAPEVKVTEFRVSNKTSRSKKLKLNNAIASESASITPSGVSASGVSVSKSKAPAEVSPALMRAYEAYNAGNDLEAQQLYKQVLLHDIRNVDALLGLGAIAQRQGRVADANGWFSKVLEVEPRNSIAQSAMLGNVTLDNDVNNETRLKNMLAKQPDDANLHTELGNYYAAQNQWPSAQQAYFDAYRLHANANNALNLAVSLDQMGKSKLALPYYQRALELAQTGSNSIDKSALEARIAAIQ